ncbi:DeoR/GlpR family DNA-binding transcription regulator [uncultured Cohaesibacter sp.]|uniref:DeoR/GlpR family DNA-binding transcription regulator n=1 Tax=uncultured Cohaesibacter sp. TaxID=1002546 RepID=UPI0029C619C0|nr:DeoR/GlpR family DNA-binding transcription regulator [uncultured Cohaesibacter sp.]
MADLTLNNPHVRQDLLLSRLEGGEQLVATQLAEEFDISIDTIRRDLLALEDRGLARRVRGGALPVRSAAIPFAQRKNEPQIEHDRLIRASLPLIHAGMSIILGGGTTQTHLAAKLEPLENLFVITPAPAIASIMLEKGIATHLVGGRMSPWGGCAVGADAEAALSNLAADLAFPAICGLDPDFGLSMDHADEASMTRCLIRAASETVLVCAAEKIGQRARHRILPIPGITKIVTDADERLMQPFKDAGAEIIHA